MELYDKLAHELPNEAKIGGAFLTMVEPHVGFEYEYNRWYEDDHFYAGAMHGPWMFSGRRWVATRELRERRVPYDSPVARPLTAGCYISTYWITAGHELHAERWVYEVMAGELAPAGRALAHAPEYEGGPARPKGRTHVYTYFHRFRFASTRDAGPMRPEHALDHPFRGMVLEIIEHPRSADELASWLRVEHLPGILMGSPAPLVVAFEAVEFTQGMNATALSQPEGLGRRLCLMWFLDDEPTAVYPPAFELHHDRLRSSGAQLLLSAPFLPTVPGTDRYVDELR